MKYTPMIEQYLKIKENYKDMFLFYRLGDFYELFFEDAQRAAKILEITLTARDGGAAGKIPMCGVPFHSSATYIDVLVNNGHKVAICEQVSEPGKGKIVERKVIQVITPGTYMNYKNYNENNYLGCIYKKAGYLYFSFCDIMTGDSNCTILNNELDLQDEILKNKIKEVLIIGEETLNIECYMTRVEKIENLLKDKTKNIKDSNLRISCDHLLDYIEKTQNKNISSLKDFSQYFQSKSMYMTNYSIRNLEVTQNMANGGKKGSLLSIIDKTSTAAGSRKIKRWLEKPLLDIKEIKNRQNIISSFIESYFEKIEIKNYLKQVYDIERIATKISYNIVTPKELLNLKNTLNQLPFIKEELKKISFKGINNISEKIDTIDELTTFLENSIDNNAGQTVKEGNVIKLGFNSELDSYKNAGINGNKMLLNIEEKEKQRSGVKNLKIGYNKIFGYFIEITKGNLKNIDVDKLGYIRKQTLSNCERFISEDLKKVEEYIINSKEKIEELEVKIFQEIKIYAHSYISRMQKLADILSDIDVFISLSDVAEEYNYVMPSFNNEGIIDIKAARHPIVERTVAEENYISNDCYFNREDNILLITGPNMSGKSTYMRQLALIVILAQIGSYVPCSSVSLPIFDKIFTRIGASDDLAGGKSTFMVEMIEAKNALVESTKNSLLIFDEIGRGTSTYDGIALAQSILQYINRTIKCKTLFSTHYHELTKLENEEKGIKNIHVSAKESNGELIFLYKVNKGPIEKSYGIHVAKLAHLPIEIIETANEILSHLESNSSQESLKKDTAENKVDFDKKIFAKESNNYEVKKENEIVKEDKKYKKMQLDFDGTEEKYNNIKKLLESVNFLETTPLEAFNILYNVKKEIDKEG